MKPQHQRDELTQSDYRGARYYDSDIGRFLSVDPLAADYADLSPYVYVADNPIFYIDPDGRTIVGSDGEAVTYSRNDEGQIIWSDNATDDIVRLGTVLLLTDMGTSSLDNMISISTEITLVIDQGVGDGAAYAAQEISRDDKGKPILNEDGTLKSTTITIYEGAFNEDKSNNTGRYSDASTNEFLNSTGVHEDAHLAPDQVKTEHSNRIGDFERVPLTAEYKARVEFRKKYGGNNKWKAKYIRRKINPENLPKPKKNGN